MYLGMYVSVQSVRCSAQSSQSFFAQRFLRKFEDNYFILQNKYLCFYKDSSGLKIHKDDCTLSKYTAGNASPISNHHLHTNGNLLPIVHRIKIVGP